MVAIDPLVNDKSVYDDGIFFRLFDEAEDVRWKMSDYAWASISPSDVSPAWVALAREALVTELTTFSATDRFFIDFADDSDFTLWLSVWLYEETKHPHVFLRWLNVFGEKFDSQFMLAGRPSQWATRPVTMRIVDREEVPVKPPSMPTLVTNILSEMLAATFYTTVAAQAGIEPVLKQIYSNVGGDEARHAASFFSFAKKHLLRVPDPKTEKIQALKVLTFWANPNMADCVPHPINLMMNRCVARKDIHPAFPLEAMHAAADNVRRRMCRVMSQLLGLEMSDLKSVKEQLAILQAS